MFFPTIVLFPFLLRRDEHFSCLNPELLNEFLLSMFFSVYLLLRERKRETDRLGEVQREETQNLNQGPGSQLSAQSPKQSSMGP